MLDKSSDISRLLDRLIGKKLVIKSISKQDKRASEIRITPQGLALLQKLDSVINLLDMEVMKLSSADAKKLNLLLESCRN